MREHYDFDKMEGQKNPYIPRLERRMTIPLDVDVIDYFEEMAKDTDVSYQHLINLYLRDCVAQHRKVDVSRLPAG
ncbi:MAG: hypothetical protein BECKG1743D_GA0114223_100815 [Candidatus Kentron sp. G]|nr:MAG: hypothetical protein BECKG1743F_GA0114225_100715 [Candidatus Kentron sp. G]VFM96832.1 MAG: hypothetical protein BECKG1743E_GA0114224_100914 [Candidatus Kentron sp. G]VFM98733.1 MAG: hypothetical protein BECKG1743D_GA0114223_100815 [Candidatus Kentron sp. G]